ncbi:60S ribosomal protein L22 [Xylographa bjoerkii]|nr:60S ribosomal protein L22 [Xylographa bjoerkii]
MAPKTSTVCPHDAALLFARSPLLSNLLVSQKTAGPKSKNVKGGKVTKKFIINASQPASDKIFDVSAFEKFLHDKVKVDGRVGNLGDTVQISQQGEGKIEVVAHTEFSGRYLKYLTKKFLKKQQLRDWLRVVSTSKGVYELRFFNVVNDDADDDDE